MNLNPSWRNKISGSYFPLFYQILPVFIIFQRLFSEYMLQYLEKYCHIANEKEKNVYFVLL